MAIVGLVARHAVAGTKGLDCRERLVLQSLAPLRIRFSAGKAGQELAHCGGQGFTLFSRPDSRPAVQPFIYGDCYIFH